VSGRDPPLTLLEQFDWAQMQLRTAMDVMVKAGVRDGSPEADLVEMLAALVLTLREHKEAVRLLREWHGAWVNEKADVPLSQTELLLTRLDGIA